MKKFYLLIFAQVFLASAAFSQALQVPQKPTHWMSPEERSHLPEVLNTFVETPPPVAPVRNVAEFDRMQGALVRYPFGIPVSLIKEMAKDVRVTTIVANNSQKNTVLQQYANAGVDTSHCDFLIAPSDSYWTRDYGPWWASDSSRTIGIVDFPYNRPSRPNDDNIPNVLAQQLGCPRYGMKLIHTGGNYMCDGMGQAASTTLVEEENPTLTEDQIKQKVHDYLGIDTYHIRPDPNNTYIDHIDCWGKFLAPDKILIRKVPPSHPQYDSIEQAAAYWETQICSYGYYYKVYRVSTPGNEPYTNSLILNNKVCLPFMGESLDDSAKIVYQTAMPGYEVLGFTALGSAPWESTDALHCRVMGIADLGMLYIHHIPLSGNQPAQDNFHLTADLIPSSDSAVYSDSVLINYRVNNGAEHTLHMISSGNFQYDGYIPKQPAGSLVSYYLYAADHSGRHSTTPFIGAPDPFEFTAVYTDLTAIPDTLVFTKESDFTEGKTTYLHNFTSSTRNITDLQFWGMPAGGEFTWNIDPNPIDYLPYPLLSGDSLPLRVIIITPIKGAPEGYVLDTMQFATDLGIHRVIIKVSDSLLTAIRNHESSDGVILENNYPNPFRDVTHLTYHLPYNTNIRLEVLDETGRTVEVLAGGTAPAGDYRVTFDATALAPGIYFCRLTTDRGVVIRKMIRMD